MPDLNTPFLCAAALLTNTSFATLAPTATEPVDDGVFAPPNAGQKHDLQLTFIGSDANNETYDARLYEWNLLDDLWVPTLLLAVSVTLSAETGVAGKEVPATSFFADTIVASLVPSDAEVRSPASDQIGYVRLFGLSGRKYQLCVDLTGAAGANAIAIFSANKYGRSY